MENNLRRGELKVKSQLETQHYQIYGPSMHDALEVLVSERQKVQNCIDAITRCMEMGLLGCQHGTDVTPKANGPTDSGLHE